MSTTGTTYDDPAVAMSSGLMPDEQHPACPGG
jgi:hypothetical protein